MKTVRLWFDWVDSESNPAGRLSRAGLGDPWTCAQDWVLTELASVAQPLWGTVDGMCGIVTLGVRSAIGPQKNHTHTSARSWGHLR